MALLRSSKQLQCLAFSFFAGLAVSAPVAATVLRLKLDGDVLGTAALARRPGLTGQDLVVLLADAAAPAQRKAVWFKRQGVGANTKLELGQAQRLPIDAVAYDVCRLGTEPAADTLVVIRPAGLYTARGDAMIKAPTLLAYRQDDELPRVRVCFDLEPGKPQIVLLPVLAGLALYRQTPAFSLTATLPQLGKVKVQGQPVRGEEALYTQRLALRLELAEASLIDYDGDGKKDLCLAGDAEIACYLQRANGNFVSTAQHQTFAVLTPDERKDTSLRTTSHLVELSGDQRADLVIRKSRYGLTDMESTIFVYRQAADGRFPNSPTQTITRPGFFSYQDYVDFDGDGRMDILAPVAALGWSELAGIALSKSATISFVWYRNTGDGRFESEPRALHELSWPVDFKNLGNIIGSLPLWGTHMIKDGGREFIFFPGKKQVEVMRMAKDGQALKLENLKVIDAEAGADALRLDMNGDGIDELLLSDPRAPDRARSLVYVEAD